MTIGGGLSEARNRGSGPWLVVQTGPAGARRGAGTGTGAARWGAGPGPGTRAGPGALARAAGAGAGQGEGGGPWSTYGHKWTPAYNIMI